MKLVYVLLYLNCFANVAGQDQWSCLGGMWKCSNNRCVWLSDRCDGRDDCWDGSDEEHCDQWSCPDNTWKCSNNRCVRLFVRCDGQDDCGDGSDEEHCDQWICPGNKWKCSNNRCVRLFVRCDGQDDCGDGSDEEHCDQWSCPGNKWKCSNNRCVRLFVRCDGQDDCGDGSDEEHCGRVHIVCPRYLMENQVHTCWCRSNNVSGSSTVRWPGLSQTRRLTLRNVQRADNGSRYTCVVTADGVREEAVYTLRLGYGPFAEDLSVSPSYLVNDGPQPVTLTCNATNVYPTPDYIWRGVTCEKQSPPNTCTFTSVPASDDLRNITCTAVNRAASHYQYRMFYTDTPPKLASRTLELNFLYKVAVESLTLNGTNETVTVNADDRATLLLVCRVFGRQVFTNVTIAKGNDTLSPSDIKYQRKGNRHFDAQVTLSERKCHHMGTYTCAVDNGHDTPDTGSIKLNVRCQPRAISRHHHNTTEGRLAFTLEASPVPEKFVFIHFGNQTSTTGTVVPSYIFAPKCQKVPVAEYMVNCHVRLQYVPSGFYRTYVHNSLGNDWFTFSVKAKEGETSTESLDSASTESLDSASLERPNAVWGAIGVVVFLGIVIAVVVIWRWRCRALQRPDSAEDDSSGLYEEIDEHPVSHQPQPPPLPVPNQNMSIPQSTAAGGGAPLSSVSQEHTQPLLAGTLPDPEEDTVTEERLLTSPDDRSRPKLPHAGIPISIITEHEQNASQSKLVQNRPSFLSDDTQGLAVSTDSWSDVIQGEDIKMTPLRKSFLRDNNYIPLQRTCRSEYFNYSRLDTSFIDEGAQPMYPESGDPDTGGNYYLELLADSPPDDSGSHDGCHLTPVDHNTHHRSCSHNDNHVSPRHSGSHGDDCLNQTVDNSQHHSRSPDDYYLHPVADTFSKDSSLQNDGHRKPALDDSRNHSHSQDDDYLHPVEDKSHKDSSSQMNPDLHKSSSCSDDDYLYPVANNTPTTSQLHPACRRVNKSCFQPPLPLPVISECPSDVSKPQDQTYLHPIPENPGDTASSGSLSLPSVTRESDVYTSKDESSNQVPFVEQDDMSDFINETNQPAAMEAYPNSVPEDITYPQLGDSTAQSLQRFSPFFKNPDESSSDDGP